MEKTLHFGAPVRLKSLGIEEEGEIFGFRNTNIEYVFKSLDNIKHKINKCKNLEELEYLENELEIVTKALTESTENKESIGVEKESELVPVKSNLVKCFDGWTRDIE